MKIWLNGKEIDFEGQTVHDLVMKYRLNPEGIVVEKNAVITHRGAYREEPLRDGDRVEIVTFVGGG